ncbi:transketolase family protein [Psychromonas sp. SR45-3]|uniref:transketolase family protein n=1 Tax=Psychromonas sp. SR45-3 TaxID=2760930 RepID=UPI0015FE7233|nr:transketolase C-terminal domain-containing protein [Psychromonas sp. SR45-3]MBB1271635.1 transketolase family protein [Psychromonas sp. SR45-3]
MISLREAFGHALVELAEKENFVVLDADVAGGTNTNFFKAAYPERFIQCGIAEQNMMSVASGLANSGLVPIVTAYGVFATLRPLDQIRNSIAYPNANVKIVASHLGLDTGPDGATHQAIEDLAVMRSIPNMVVISPADELETQQATEAIIKYQGPVYMRSGRSPVPTVHADDYQFEIGKANVLKHGKGKTTIIATGIMVYRALQAAENSDITVINMSTIKPLDEETVLLHCKNAEHVITCEDHNIIGGLGSAIAEVLAENNINAKLKRIGIEDKFGMSGEPEELAALYNISTESIKNAIINK